VWAKALGLKKYLSKDGQLGYLSWLNENDGMHGRRRPSMPQR